MSLQKLINQPVVVQKFGASTDRYGNTVPNDTVTLNTVAYIEQFMSVETMNDRDVSVSSFFAYFLPDTPIASLDRVVFNNQTFEVDGEPWQVYNPRVAALSHIRAKLKVVS